MKIAVVSLGCPKNQVDADVMCHSLLAAGHETVAEEGEADVVIVNTCGFIQSAKEEAIQEILTACAHKAEKPDLKVVVTGCLAERYRGDIRAEIPEVDAVVSIGSDAAIAQVVGRLTGGPIELFTPNVSMPLGGKRVISTPRHYAYLKIAEGCSNGCYYCAIPGIRGPLRSRPLGDCIQEAKWLASEGVRELILVAQDPTAYGEDWGQPGAITRLLDQLNTIEGLAWIRILYAYPERISDAFIAAMLRNDKVLPYLDLPIQHCSDSILERMNRRGRRADIESAVSRLRQRIPGIALRTTLIAGFPGETEEDFDELCAFVKEARFDRLGCFAYSPEEGTKAAGMEGQLPEEEKERRAALVMEVQANIMAEKQAARVGTQQLCICDGLDEEGEFWRLRTAADAPEIDGCVLTPAAAGLEEGRFYLVNITDSDVYDLYGEVEKEVSL